MAGPIVLNKEALVHFNFTGPVVVDVSCYTIALELTPNVEEVDVGTFCNPTATETGRVTYTALLAMLWAPELYALLQPHVGAQALLSFAPDAAHAADYVRFTTRYAALPWGRFELGQRVEVDLPLAVIDTPTWVDGAGLLAAELQPAEPAATEPEGAA
jgi:hypothetical protein